MAEVLKDKFLVIKNEDIEKYCAVGDLNALDFIIHKIKRGRARDGKQMNNYYVCNADEPYAAQVLQTILQGEDEKTPKSKEKLKQEIDARYWDDHASDDGYY